MIVRQIGTMLMKRSTAPAPLLAFRVAHGTRKGTARAENQDAAAVLPLPAEGGQGGMLCVVADGVGGLRHGATASAVAVQTVAGVYGPVAAAVGDPGEALRRAALAAHDAVRRATAEAGTDGGATTLVAAVLQGSELWIASVGDSRAYLLGPDGQLAQITRDHSWAAEQVSAGLLTPEQAAAHPWRNMITRCLGGETAPEVDVARYELTPGARLLLCTDGLYGSVGQPELADELRQEPQAAVNTLLQLADERQAGDDATLCVVAAGDPRGRAALRPAPNAAAAVSAPDAGGTASARRRLLPPVVQWLALVTISVLLLGAAAAGGFVALTNGRVTPGVSVAGTSLGGLDTEAATAAVTQALTPVMACAVTVQAGSESWVRTPADLGLWVDAPATVQQAQAVGRRGSPLEQATERIRTLVQGTPVAPAVLVDEAAVLEQVETMAAAYGQTAGPLRGDRIAVQPAVRTVSERLLAQDCGVITLPLEPASGAPAPAANGTD